MTNKHQKEADAVAVAIEAHRTGVYVLSDDERAAIAEAREGGLASDQDMMAFRKRHGLA